MSNQSTKVVVVLAAGLGSRLKSENSVPKPLRVVAGRPLLLRVLDRFREAGITEAVVVLGHRGDEIRDAVVADDAPMDIRFVRNDRFLLGNGLSVLAAADAVKQQSFFISMADHIFDPQIILGLKNALLPEQGLLLAVDRKLDTIFDMDDATKVRTDGRKILSISKSLETFDAIDTGLFRSSPALFDAIAAASATHPDGDCTLSEGVEALRQNGVAEVYDIQDARWQDVDTPETEAHAAEVFGD